MIDNVRIIDALIMFCFGGIAISAAAVLIDYYQIARVEAQAARAHNKPLRKDRPFVLALSLLLGAIGLIGVAVVRTWDGLAGLSLGGSQPAILLASLVLLWASKSGFHWAATLDRRRWHWRLYVASIVVWTGVVAWLLIRE